MDCFVSQARLHRSMAPASKGRAVAAGLIVLLAALPTSAGRAAGGTAESTRDRSDAAPDATRIDRDLRDLRELVRAVQRAEQEHFEMLRRLLDKQGSAAAATDGASGPAGGAKASGPTEARPGMTMTPPPVPAPSVPPVEFAAVKGRVTVKGGAHDLYVYLEGFRSNAGRRAHLEIAQISKAFDPVISVALVGTRVTFPNRDTFFHNVFSPSPVPFDLGMYRAGETSPEVTLGTPGVVEIFCNIHSQMRAQILVVPNRVFTRVASDGTFRLDKVPTGSRKLVAWGPGLQPVRVEVAVPTTGASVDFDLQPETATSHRNKFGFPYGAYKE